MMSKTFCGLVLLLALLPVALMARTPAFTGKRVLVVFFSRTGENHKVGFIHKGNTHIVAEMIARKTGGRLFEIVPREPYPDDYRECVQRVVAERKQRARPEYVGDVAVDSFDVVFVGYPNWCADMPMVVYTFLERHRWAGKTIVPFCTHEASGLSNTEQFIAATCPGATLLPGLAVFGTVAQQRRSEAETIVEQWLDTLP